MRIGHVELFCRDVATTRVFYEHLGLRAVSVQGAGAFVWMACASEGTPLLLRSGGPPPAAVRYTDSAQALVLYTDDLESVRGALSARGIEPLAHDGGCPLYRDPDGRWIQIVDPGDHGG